MDYNVVTERLPNGREVLQMIEKRQQTIRAFFKKRRKLKVFLIILLVIIFALAIDFFMLAFNDRGSRAFFRQPWKKEG